MSWNDSNHLISHNYCGLGIWEQRGWAVLACGFLWDCSQVSVRCSLRPDHPLLRWLTYMANMVSAAHWLRPRFSMRLIKCPHCIAAGLFKSWQPKGAWWESQGLLRPSPKVTYCYFHQPWFSVGGSYTRAGMPGGKNYPGLSWKLATTATQAGYSL